MTPRPSIAVVEAVAAKEGTRPRDLECLLADTIDPVALDTLFHPTPGDRERTEGHVRFRYCGYLVTVRSDRTVEVERPS